MLTTRLISAAVLVALSTLSLNAQQQDVKGSKDHPLFTRMPGYYIWQYEQKEFDGHNFDAGSKQERVEGRKTIIKYSITTAAKANPPSLLQIIRNHTNAIKKIGGMVTKEDARSATMKLVKEDGGEVWAWLFNENDSEYYLTIVEKAEMKQEVTASDMLSALEKSGRIALYINFDTAKADIKPESQPVIDEIVALLRNNRAINVSIEGHTDNVGGAPANQKLSEARAKAVMDAIVAKGVAAARLSSAGFGQTKPLADNATEAGRAKNRRVELVKK